VSLGEQNVPSGTPPLPLVTVCPDPCHTQCTVSPTRIDNDDGENV
jgi:hypothetical protein